MAYVSLAVNVGCFNDPLKRQGLAHFLEHMIFMGSEKYPEEQAFEHHITHHGGESNAYTQCEFTNFQFSVNQDGLEKALDLFAWLFAKPLLLKDSMEREI